ncbi:C1orf87 [Bugula neritina]|uniref:C1orf87 n=1 Tax=Bugula neritina TaxID=10212 RepID=A0A7J7JWA3_BUGNE|nr:C1orf87 [Bugula neritina]
MESAAPYDTTFTPEYRLKIIGGKPTYVPDYSNRRPDAPPPQSLPSTGSSSGGRSSAEKRNTWTSHSVLPPIMSPRSQLSRSNSGSHGYSPPIPSQPISLSKIEEMELLRSLGASLEYNNMDVLKQIYNEITSSYDHALSGWAYFSDVSLTLVKCQVNLSPENLKTAASLFVSPEKPGSVNYERLLSFLASAIKLHNTKKDPRYFSQAGEKQKSNLDFLSINTRAPRPTNEISGAQGKLIRMVEDQLAQGDFALDVEQLRNQFTLADRLHRDSLSHGEIKEICYRNRVPLQESVINHVLDRCRTTGDGQYRWTDFIDFLEKVQGTGTGLTITSKQPSEYVKKLPSPMESWPRPDVGRAEPPSTYKHSPRVPYQEQVAQELPSHGRDSETPQLAYGSQVPSATDYLKAEGKQVQSDAVQTENIESRSSTAQLKSLLPQRLAQGNGEESWLDKFGMLAQALYRNDLDKNGIIKADECRWLLTEYNEIYGLNLNKLAIDQGIQQSTSAAGTSIDSVLKILLTSAQE